VSSASLSPISYIVLALIARSGAATPYDLKREVAKSVGYFWAFPHSQLYAEPARLAAAGLLDERQEEGGRRRRTYSLTSRGRAALDEWLSAPAAEATQIRDLGLLKLFFAESLEPEQVVALAREQEALHRERLAHYEQLEQQLAGHDDVAFARAPLRMGIHCEGAFVRFWSDVAARPPVAAARRAARA
jgi:PadR family transcriptional regulator AphA